MSRIKRHDKMKQKISELCEMLPFDDDLKKSLDSQSILRLTLSTMRVMKNAQNQERKESSCQVNLSLIYFYILFYFDIFPYDKYKTRILFTLYKYVFIFCKINW